MPATIEELLADASKGVIVLRVGEDGKSLAVSWLPGGKEPARHDVIDDIHEQFERLQNSEDSFWQCVLGEVNAGESLGTAMLTCLHRVL